MRRRPDIQGLRGIAVLAVVLYHAGVGMPGGFTGVDVFFVISGFVIAGTLTAELERGGRISFRGFYLRRAKRLLPALATMIVAVDLLAVVAAPVGAQAITARTGIWSSLFGANAYLYRLGTGYFDVAAALDPFLHTWTLAVEEQFYVLFPIVLVAGWRLRGRRGALVATSAVTVVSFAVSLALSHGLLLSAAHRPQALAFYGSPARAWEFGVGAALSLVAPRLPTAAALAPTVLGVTGAAAVVAAVLAIHGKSGFPGTEALLPVGGAAAIIAAGTYGSSIVSRSLGLHPLQWLGDRSYSWYLWHWPFIVFGRALVGGRGWVAPAAVAISLAPAAASFRWIENPIRRSPSVGGRPMLARIAVWLAAPLCASAGLLAAGHALQHTGALRAWSASRAPHADAIHGCEGERSTLGTASCTWRATNPGGTVALVGDSNASHFAEAVIAAGRRSHLTVTMSTFYGCPVALVRVGGSSAGESACRSFVTATLAGLLRLRPDVVVLAARDDDYLAPPLELRSFGGTTASTPQARRTTWEHGLANVIRRLNRAGAAVLVVAPVPRLPQPDDCAVVRLLTHTCGGATSRRAADAELGPALATERTAVAAAPRAALLDLRDAFCSPTRCSNTRAGAYLYFDSDHLSVEGSRLLATRFSRALAALSR